MRNESRQQARRLDSLISTQRSRVRTAALGAEANFEYRTPKFECRSGLSVPNYVEDLAVLDLPIHVHQKTSKPRHLPEAPRQLKRQDACWSIPKALRVLLGNLRSRLAET